MKKFFSLYEIQTQIMQVIQSEASVESIRPMILEKPPISIKQRIEIYQEAHRLRMLGSLVDDFSRVVAHLGENEFKKIAQNYLKKYPSCYASLAEFSQSFPIYVREISEELFDLASIDWIEILSQYAVGIDQSQKVSLTEIESGTSFNLKKNPSLNTFTGINTITITYKVNREVQVETLTRQEFSILDHLINSKNFEQFSGVIETLSVDSIWIQSLISEWIRKEIIFCERIPTC